MAKSVLAVLAVPFILALALGVSDCSPTPKSIIRSHLSQRLFTCLKSAGNFQTQRQECQIKARMACEKVGLEVTCAEDDLWTRGQQ